MHTTASRMTCYVPWQRACCMAPTVCSVDCLPLNMPDPALALPRWWRHLMFASYPGTPRRARRQTYCYIASQVNSICDRGIDMYSFAWTRVQKLVYGFCISSLNCKDSRRQSIPKHMHHAVCVISHRIRHGWPSFRFNVTLSFLTVNPSCL